MSKPRVVFVQEQPAADVEAERAAVEVDRRVVIPHGHRHVVEGRARRERPGVNLVDDVGVPHLVVVDVALDELEEDAVGVEEER